MIPIPNGGGGGLGPGPVIVVPDPDLLAAQPEMMSAAASSYQTAAYTVSSVAKATNSVGSELISAWKGKGAIGFHGQMNDLTQYSTAAADSLIGVALTLTTLASRITAAQNLAKRALALAQQTTDASNSLDQAYTSTVRHNVANLKPNATAAQVLAAAQPSAGQSARAAALANDATDAVNMMNQANAMARQAWAAATSAFDAVTAQSPSVQAAAVAANVNQMKRESLNMTLLMLVNAYGGMEVDYGGDGEEEPVAADVPQADMADAAIPSEITALEKSAVDGERIDGQTAADAEGGIGVGYSDNVSILLALEQDKLSGSASQVVSGADPLGGNSPSQYQSKFWDPNANGGRGSWVYPPNHGAEPGTTLARQGPTAIQPGTMIDRFGPPSGNFASPEGTPWAERALPATSLLGGPASYHVYEVTDKWSTSPPPVTVVQSKVAPAFDQPGGGVQYEFVGPPGAPSNAPKVNINWLVKNGYLREVTPSP